jgi:hypothetical protein
VAGRYTDYSVSGSVQTWKVGLDWHVNPSGARIPGLSLDCRGRSAGGVATGHASPSGHNDPEHPFHGRLVRIRLE